MLTGGFWQQLENPLMMNNVNMVKPQIGMTIRVEFNALLLLYLK